MPTLVHFVLPDEEPTMAILPEPFARAPSHLFEKAAKKKKSSSVQINLFGNPAVLTTKTTKVKSFTKKNGTFVGSHNRIVKAKKPQSKSNHHHSEKTSKSVKTAFFQARGNDCKESVQLAMSLHIEEKLKLARGN